MVKWSGGRSISQKRGAEASITRTRFPKIARTFGSQPKRDAGGSSVALPLTFQKRVTFLSIS